MRMRQMRPAQPFKFAVWILGFVSLVGAVGCSGKTEPAAAEAKRFRPVDEAGATAASSENSSTQPAATATASTGGESTAGDAGGGELQATLEQLDRLAQQPPKGSTQQEQLEDLLRIHTQRLALANKALALNPASEVKQRIVMAMYEIHQVFAQLGTPNAMKQLTDFAKKMAADADQEVARIGRQALFTGNLTRIASQPLENGKEIVAEAQKLLEAESTDVSQSTEQLLAQTVQLLQQSGFNEDAAALIDSLATALGANPAQAERAKRYSAHAKIARADLQTKLDNVLKGEENAKEKIVAAIQELTSTVSPGRDLLSETYKVAHLLEATGNYESAQQCYDAIATAFKDVDQEELADAKGLAEKARQRMSLIGQPLTVEGVLADGQPFDWNAYEGKVVLVDFWASWCKPCIDEIPNIKESFEQFHAKGFEVIGVNLNTNPADLKQFLSFQELPWATVTTQEALDGKVKEQDWTKLPMAARCGVHSIPFVVLIGKDGKVDSIHVRGSKLKSRLTALLGEPITTEVPADPTQPARPATSAIPPASNVR